MRWLTRFLVFIVIIGTNSVWAADGVLPGSGIEGDPYMIEDLADFDVFADSENSPTYWASGVYTKLACDPNLAGRPYETAVIDGTYYGHFDGDGHVIRNITIDTESVDTNYLGLFGTITASEINTITPSVSNLGIENINITSGDFSQFIGGLAGYNENSIVDCYTSGNVTGGEFSFNVGGLCGKSTGPDYGVRQSTIQNCHSTANVTGDTYVGGLIGHSGAILAGCYSRGSVSGYGSVGGLTGRGGGSGSITNCYSSGLVIGDNNLGGLCGYNKGEITNCYATGPVIGGFGSSTLGGLCGGDQYDFITNCFWDIETGGPDNGFGTPLPTAQMQTLSTFLDAGWDFINAWNIGENQTYPFIRNHSASDLNKDRAVNVIDLSILAEQWMKEG